MEILMNIILITQIKLQKKLVKIPEYPKANTLNDGDTFGTVGINKKKIKELPRIFIMKIIIQEF